MTTHRLTPGEPGSRRQGDVPYVPAPRQPEDDWRELHDDPYHLGPDDYENWRELHDDPYDLPGPDDYEPWHKHGAKFHIVVDQRRDWQHGGPPSLAELLENLARTRDPEPDLEAEP